MVDDELFSLPYTYIHPGASGMIRARHKIYRAGSLLGDAEAIASLRPTRILKRLGNHLIGSKLVRMFWLK